MATNDLVTESGLDALSAAVVAQINNLRSTRGDLASLSTTAKTSLVAAINEVVASIAGAGATINDTGTSTSSVWSSDKTNSEIATAVAAVVNSAPGVLDTLDELAAALGDDENFAATISTALGLRLRVDTAVQGLTGTQQSNALANLGLARSSQDFAGDFTAAVV